MNMKKYYVNLVIGFALVISGTASAEKDLSANEIKTLFSNKTFDGTNVKKDRNFKVYSSSDGAYIKKGSNGKIKEGKWKVDSSGNYCVEIKKERCGKVVSVGNGVYHYIRKDKHIHTMKNFIVGNNLEE